jgi:hypothetical protein
MIGTGLMGSLDIGLRGGAIALFLLIAVAVLRHGAVPLGIVFRIAG